MNPPTLYCPWCSLCMVFSVIMLVFFINEVDSSLSGNNVLLIKLIRLFQGGSLIPVLLDLIHPALCSGTFNVQAWDGACVLSLWYL